MNELKPYISHIQLPHTRLHVMQVGSGAPALIVPATFSHLEDWRELVQFVGQYYDTHFFELPGHGSSEPYPVPYSSGLAAITIEDLLDVLAIDQVTLFGFSFGGILTLKSLQRLGDRVKEVILLAPCMGPVSLRYSSVQQFLLRQLLQLIKQPPNQLRFLKLLQHRVAGPYLLKLLMLSGNLEKKVGLGQKMEHLSLATLDVLTRQLAEIFSIQFPQPAPPYSQPCHLGMSIHDPLLRMDRTELFLREQFTNLHTTRFTHPYHQPPRKFSVKEYDQKYGPLLTAIHQMA